MSCVLRAVGDAFDVEAFLAKSPFHPNAIYRKGEPLVEGASAARARSVSGFNLSLGEAGLADVAGQIQGALDFLDEHEEELRRLGAFPGVDQVFLDFGIERGTGPAQTDLFPAELLWRIGALDIDLAVTHYAAGA